MPSLVQKVKRRHLSYRTTKDDIFRTVSIKTTSFMQHVERCPLWSRRSKDAIFGPAGQKTTSIRTAGLKMTSLALLVYTRLHLSCSRLKDALFRTGRLKTTSLAPLVYTTSIVQYKAGLRISAQSACISPS